MIDNKINLKITIDSENKKVQIFNDGIKQLDRSFHDVSLSAERFGGISTSVAKGMGIYSVLASAVNSLSSSFSFAAKSGIEYNRSMQNALTTLTVFEGSSQKAAKSLEWVETFAKETPYAFEEVKDAFVKLKAYGIDPIDGTLETLGDTASALGKSIIDAVEAMADAVTGENERLKEFGITASKMGDKIEYSWTNASGVTSKKVIDNNKRLIQSTLEAIFNEKYKGLMKERSKGWDAATSNMQASWNKLAGRVSEPLFEELTKDMNETTKLFSTFTEALDDNVSMVELDTLRATIVGTAYSINILYETVENTAQNAINGIASLTYTALAPISHAIRVATVGLNSIGLATDEAVQQAFEHEIFILEAADKAEKSTKENYKEIADSIDKASMSIKQRVTMYQNERDEIKKNKELLDAQIVNTPVNPFVYFKDEIKSNNDYYKKLEKESLEASARARETYAREVSEKEKFYIDNAFNYRINSYDKLKEERAKRKELRANEHQESLADIEAEGELSLQYYNDQLDAQNSLNSAIENMDMGSADWLSGLDGIAGAMGNISNSFADMETAQIRYNKAIALAGNDQKALAQIQAKDTRNQIQLYGNLAGSLSGVFEEGSAEAKAAILAQQALAVANGIATVLNVGASGDGYSALARVAAAIGVVGSVLAMGDIAFGGSSGSSNPEYQSYQEKEVAPLITSFSDLNDSLSLDFETFQDGLNSATEALKKFGNKGTSFAESINALQIQKDKLEYNIEASENIEDSFLGKVVIDGTAYTQKQLQSYYTSQISEIDALIQESLLDSLSQSIDYTKFSSSELKKLIPADFNLDEYNMMLDELNILGVKAKKGELSAFDREAVAAFSSSEAYITGQDYEAPLALLQQAREASEKNITSWKDSFKSADEIVAELANSMGVELANDAESLNALYLQLAQSGGELSAAELDLLTKNRELIGGLKDTRSEFEKLVDISKQFNSIDLTISKLRGDSEETKLAQAGQTYADFTNALGYNYTSSEVIDRFMNASVDSLERWNAQLDDNEQLSTEALSAFNTIMSYRLSHLDEVVENISLNFEDIVSSLESVSSTVESSIASIYSNNKEVLSEQYRISLRLAQEAQQAFVNDTQNVALAEAFNVAVGDVTSQVSGYLDKGNFSSKFDYMFAQASTVNTLDDFGNTASTTVDYLHSIQLATEATASALNNPVTPSISTPVNNSRFSGVGGSNPAQVDTSASTGEWVFNGDGTFDWKAYANGGYTGESMGIVHPNEYVLNKETSSMMGLNDSSSTGVFAQMVKKLDELTAEVRNLQYSNEVMARHVKRLDERDDRFKRSTS